MWLNMARKPLMNLIAERITDFPALEALREDWQALSVRIPENTDFFATWDYTWTYLNVHRPANWQVVAVREDDGALVAVFPLLVFQIAHDGQTFRACQPLGTGYLPYVEFPVDSAVRRDVLQVLLNSVLQQQLAIDVALFWPLHQASPLYLTLLEDLGRTEILKTLRFPDNLHEIETRGQDLTTHQQHCSIKSFKDAAYKTRKLGRLGELRFTLCEPTANVRSLTETLCQQNLQKFGEQHACRHLPHWSAYLPALGEALAATGLAQLSTLRLDGEVIASILSFVHKQRRYLYLIDYDPKYLRYSPSKILLAKLVEQTFSEGGIFCFGAGSTPYKRDWGPVVGELKAAIVFFNPTARAALEAQLTLNGLNSLGGVQ